MLSRRKLFGFLAAAPIAAVAGRPALACGGPVSKGRPYLVGETPSETMIPLKSLEVRHPAIVRPVTITINNPDDYKIRLGDWPGIKLIGDPA